MTLTVFTPETLKFSETELIPRGRASAIKYGQVVWFGPLDKIQDAPNGSVFAINPADYRTLKEVFDAASRSNEPASTPQSDPETLPTFEEVHGIIKGYDPW